MLNPPKMILVTGSSGFIGSHYVESLIESGIEVVGLDIEPYPYKKNSLLTTIVGNVSDLKLFDSEIRNADRVVHFAARPSVPDSWEDPYKTMLVNCAASSSLIDACRHHSTPLYVASSSSIYGLEGSEANPYKPISPYGASKAAMEMTFQAYQSQKKLNGGVLRFFNVFGPRHRVNSANPPVIARLLECARLNKTFELEGDGTQSRDFTFVTDLVYCINKVVMNLENVELPLEISFHKTINLNDLIDTVEKITNTKIHVKKVRQRVGDIKYSRANNSFTELLNEKINSTDLERALEITWKWHLGLRSI